MHISFQQAFQKGEWDLDHFNFYLHDNITHMIIPTPFFQFDDDPYMKWLIGILDCCSMTMIIAFDSYEDIRHSPCAKECLKAFFPLFIFYVVI